MQIISYARFGGPPAWWKEVRVWVNGAEVTDICFEADEVAGWARCHIYKNGLPYLNSRETGVRWRKVRGKVEIRRRLGSERQSKVTV